jgi:hypothetical protein
MAITEQQRFKMGRTSRIDPEQNHLLNMNQVAFRWSVGPVVARRRLEKAGVPLIRFHARSVEVWLSDLLNFEARFTKSN